MGQGDIVLLTAPTGTGKSHFVLYDLLKWTIKNRQKILYVVNRKILKAQIEAEIKKEVALKLHEEFNGYPINVQNYITVLTYQSIERRLKDSIQQEVNWLKSFWYVVYDECHYFYSDANFNTSTELSYDCLRREFYDKVQIFISATMKNMEKMIQCRDASFLNTSEIDNGRRLADPVLELGKKRVIPKEKFNKWVNGEKELGN